MQHTHIEIQDAHTHNLKHVDLTIPKHCFVVFTGVSGSGKSSLLFDTIYTEAQRQLVETFSTFARSRLPKLSRPDVEAIRNLSTAILIDQRPMGANLRSTVGTATEVVTYLRLLFSRIAQPFIGPSFYYSFNHPEGMCPHCHGLGTRIDIDLARLINPALSLREGAVDHPECRVGGFLWRELLAIKLFDPDKKLAQFSEEELHLLLHTEPVPIEKPHGAGTYIKNWEGLARRFERLRTAKAEGEQSEERKNAYERYFTYRRCDACGGTRLNRRALDSRLAGRNLGELCAMELVELVPFVRAVREQHGGTAEAILRKAALLLETLVEIGVGYLSLERPVSTLSGGEAQRVKLARQLDCDLTDLMYVLDEPSVGLHPRDTHRLLELLARLQAAGNSVLVVEHDPDIIRAADWVVDVGPGGGAHGGTIVYNGPSAAFTSSGTATALALAQPVRVQPSEAVRTDPTTTASSSYRVENAVAHNLRAVNAAIPRGFLTCVTGVAGSGKSSLIHECFLPAHPQSVVIDQKPIGRTSRGNLATYTGVFDTVRKIFATATGHEAALFSFNSRGACPKCNGQGVLTTELFFLDAVQTVCDECAGKRYHPEVLELRYNGHDIHEVLEMTAAEARAFFTHRTIRAQMDLLLEVGLDYLKIGQSLSSLSGGEAQRLKIAAELRKTGNIYIMDEPTTGLHLNDIARLYGVIRRLTTAGNTVIVIEHNPELIKNADWIIDLGPEGGSAGGRVLYDGPPAGLVAVSESHTAAALRDYWIAPER